MVFTGTVGEPVTMTVGGNAATVDANNNWRGHATVKTGANAIPLVATDVDKNTTTKTINVTVSGGAARIPKYDANGNLTNDGNGKVYAYDAGNRLVSVTQTVNGVQTVTGYVYNGLGRRVRETSNGTVVKQWVWCPGDIQPCEERDGSNNVTKRFYGHGEQIGGVNYYFTKDHEGSIREMTNASGALVARYDYDPYGRRTLVSGTDLADFGFTGYYYDQATGLDFSRTRVYSADLGRWLSRDPIGEKGGINLYDYVLNDPINRTDPLGLQPELPPNLRNLPPELQPRVPPPTPLPIHIPIDPTIQPIQLPPLQTPKGLPPKPLPPLPQPSSPPSCPPSPPGWPSDYPPPGWIPPIGIPKWYFPGYNIA